MPANRPYPGENPAAAKKRIASNKAKAKARQRNANTPIDKAGASNEPKTNGDMMASNVGSIIKNMGY